MFSRTFFTPFATQESHHDDPRIALQGDSTTCAESVRLNWCRFSAIWGSLDQLCPLEPLFSLRLRVTVERKVKYESTHTIVYPESLPVAGLPAAEGWKRARCWAIPGRGSHKPLAFLSHLPTF